MNNLAGEPLVQRLTGGKGGDGTRFAPCGEQLVKNFRLIEQEHRRLVDQLSREAQVRGTADDFLLLRRLNMKISARNQFSGKVTAVKRGAVNDEIEVEVVAGHKLAAIVTHESTEALGLCVGAEVLALVKSSSIIVVTGDSFRTRFSASNRLSGIVSRVKPGVVNSDVAIELTGGGTMAGIITQESVGALGLVAGAKAMGIFKASSVILAASA